MSTHRQAIEAQPERGFTLLEVMVAIFVLSIAATAVVQATSSTLRRADFIAERQLALWVADSALATAIIESTPQSTNGKMDFGGRTFLWQLQGSDTETEGLNKLVVTVSTPDDEQTELSRLTGFRTNK